jgi:hypothetical protein
VSTDTSNLTVADRARRAAENIDRIANAATGDRSAASQLDGPLQLVDAISYDMLYVLDWVERRQGADTAAALRARLSAVVSALDKAPQKAPSGALILDLFGQARHLAWSLRNRADDIEVEDGACESPFDDDSTGAKRPRMTVQQANAKAMELAKRMGKAFFALSETAQAVRIGCHWKTWSRTEFYQDAKKKAPPRKKGSGKAVVSLTDTLEAVAGAGKANDVLEQTIADEDAARAKRKWEASSPNRGWEELSPEEQRREINSLAAADEELERLTAEQRRERQADQGRKFHPRRRL